MSFEPGTVIAGKYRVERIIGEGGMGVVLAARHLGLDEMVAVKLIREARAAGAETLARFQREARAAARIKSEHVARVLDVDRLPEGEPYIVMELIDGSDLSALMQQRGSLPPDEAASYIMQACEGVAEAHALGMVHRDLKLKNLFLTKRRDGRALIKVIDFGVVKLTRGADDADPTLQIRTDGQVLTHDATLTGAAMLVGSVHYMAPEQIRASNIVDARADVWSLGVCLYALLTGDLPFDGSTVGEVCASIQGRPAPDPRTFAPQLPPELASVVMRALEKDVRRRFASVGELALALGPFSPDAAAAGRIENILRSGPRSSYAPPPPAPAGFDRVTAHATAPAFASPPVARARVESTIDAAATGSLIPPPVAASSKKRGAFVTAALSALALGAATLTFWPRPATRAVADDATNAASGTFPPAPAIPTAPGPLATAPPAPTVLAEPPPMPFPSSTPSPTAVIATAAPTGRAPGKRSPVRAPKATAATPLPIPTAKTEPSSAYDHF